VINLTKEHFKKLGNPQINRKDFLIWSESDDAVIEIAKEFNIYESILKKHPDRDANNFGFAKCAKNEIITTDAVCIFGYFYDYPNPVDNGFILILVNDYHSLGDNRELIGILENLGLDLFSDDIKNQIKNQG
jgi:hypothetical protein